MLTAKFGMYVSSPFYIFLFAHSTGSPAPDTLQDSVEADIRSITTQMLHGQVDVP